MMAGAYLITGSRKQTLGLMNAVHRALDAAQPDFLILGDCPTGADAFALTWAKAHGVEYGRHFADWRRYRKRAGPLRNCEMVKQGVELGAKVLAFPRGIAAGTGDCIAQATAAGLEVEQR